MTDPSFARPDDPLADLRERVRATRAAAERLGEEAAEAMRAQREGRVPPRGWATPQERDDTREGLQVLVGMLESIRDLVPAELQQQVREVVRKILLLIRAIIDWWLDRFEAAARPAAATVEEIPIR
jgi:hypothetical protein